MLIGRRQIYQRHQIRHLGALLLIELTAEASNWENPLGRILEVVLLLRERGLELLVPESILAIVRMDIFLKSSNCLVSTIQFYMIM
jgi:hypothetical protein